MIFIVRISPGSSLLYVVYAHTLDSPSFFSTENRDDDDNGHF